MQVPAGTDRKEFDGMHTRELRLSSARISAPETGETCVLEQVCAFCPGGTWGGVTAAGAAFSEASASAGGYSRNGAASACADDSEMADE